MSDIERTNPNRYENRYMLNMMVVMHTIVSDRETIEKRLKPWYPDIRRDAGLLIYLVKKIQEELMTTFPEKRNEYYYKIAQYGQMQVDIPGPIPKGRHLLMDVEDAAALAEAAMRGECVMCMREGREIRRCPIRTALLPIAPPSEEGGVACEYRRPASQLIQGEDVTI